jgi:hypothetical protein
MGSVKEKYSFTDTVVRIILRELWSPRGVVSLQIPVICGTN